MSLIPNSVWKQLETLRPTGDELIAREAMPGATKKVLAAIDVRGRRHVLVHLNHDEDGCEDVRSRGLSVMTEELLLPESVPGRYIHVICEDSAGHPMFDLIGGEIADRVVLGEEAPAESVSRVLGKWRRFWGQNPRQVLTREAQIGLFSELWFLAYWLIPAIGISEAVTRWRGPYGARHDFEHPGLSVEA